MTDNKITTTEQFEHIYDSLSLFKIQIESLQKIVKVLEKDVKRETSKKKNEKEIKIRKPSGFAKPVKISNELCDFMNITRGSLIARTHANKIISEYIKSNNLFLKGNKALKTKNRIIPDEKLSKLLNIDSDDLNDLNYFTMQKYMNKHFKQTDVNNV
jgi:hypothetical protein